MSGCFRKVPQSSRPRPPLPINPIRIRSLAPTTRLALHAESAPIAKVLLFMLSLFLLPFDRSSVVAPTVLPPVTARATGPVARPPALQRYVHNPGPSRPVVPTYPSFTSKIPG